ncbi:15748_t:CDS:2 [Rhizophagus irregularis]|nr:15748_t:CDS:2 [Rhizophagus irregularis]
MSTQVLTRETRQISKINQIFTKINETLTRTRDQNIIKIELDKFDDHIREAVHSIYKAEIINKDIFIKIDGGLKTTIHFDLVISARAHNPNWFVVPTTTCIVGPNSYGPDVGIWYIRPTFNQLGHPILYACPPPNVWIEDPDRQHALNNFNDVQQINPTIEFVGIALPDMIRCYRQNPAPGVASVHVKPENDQTARPSRASGSPMWVEASTEYCSGRNFSALNDYYIIKKY